MATMTELTHAAFMAQIDALEREVQALQNYAQQAYKRGFAEGMDAGRAGGVIGVGLGALSGAVVVGLAWVVAVFLR